MINWEQIYKSLISKKGLNEKPNDIYTEVHHIVPRYLGGTNSADNLVRLYLRDHTLAHYILWKWKGNLQDRVAYLMKGGQTEEGNRFRVQLAQEALRRSDNYSFKHNNPSKNPEIVEKSKQTKRKKYNGNFHSKEGLERIKLLCNSGSQHSPEAKQKKVKTLKQTKEAMSNEAYYEKYVKPFLGENNPNFGKKRPNELAGNYGTNKGTYTLITPDGERFEFKGITKLMKYGVGEHIIRSWKNKGIIKPQPSNARSPWIGYQIEFKPNPKYGQVNRSIQKSKRILKIKNK